MVGFAIRTVRWEAAHLRQRRRILPGKWARRFRFWWGMEGREARIFRLVVCSDVTRSNTPKSSNPGLGKRLRQCGTAFDCWRAPPSWSVSLWAAQSEEVSVLSVDTLSVSANISNPFGVTSLKKNPLASRMSEREDNVYKAKLAEQAERYDGKWLFLQNNIRHNNEIRYKKKRNKRQEKKYIHISYRRIFQRRPGGVEKRERERKRDDDNEEKKFFFSYFLSYYYYYYYFILIELVATIFLMNYPYFLSFFFVRFYTAIVRRKNRWPWIRIWGKRRKEKGKKKIDFCFFFFAIMGPKNCHNEYAKRQNWQIRFNVCNAGWLPGCLLRCETLPFVSSYAFIICLFISYFNL